MNKNERALREIKVQSVQPPPFVEEDDLTTTTEHKDKKSRRVSFSDTMHVREFQKYLNVDSSVESQDSINNSTLKTSSTNVANITNVDATNMSIPRVVDGGDDDSVIVRKENSCSVFELNRQVVYGDVTLINMTPKLLLKPSPMVADPVSLICASPVMDASNVTFAEREQGSIEFLRNSFSQQIQSVMLNSFVFKPATFVDGSNLSLETTMEDVASTFLSTCVNVDSGVRVALGFDDGDNPATTTARMLNSQAATVDCEKSTFADCCGNKDGGSAATFNKLNASNGLNSVSICNNNNSNFNVLTSTINKVATSNNNNYDGDNNNILPDHSNVTMTSNVDNISPTNAGNISPTCVGNISPTRVDNIFPTNVDKISPTNVDDKCSPTYDENNSSLQIINLDSTSVEDIQQFKSTNMFSKVPAMECKRPNNKINNNNNNCNYNNTVSNNNNNNNKIISSNNNASINITGYNNSNINNSINNYDNNYNISNNNNIITTASNNATRNNTTNNTTNNDIHNNTSSRLKNTSDSSHIKGLLQNISRQINLDMATKKPTNSTGNNKTNNKSIKSTPDDLLLGSLSRFEEAIAKWNPPEDDDDNDDDDCNNNNDNQISDADLALDEVLTYFNSSKTNQMATYIRKDWFEKVETTHEMTDLDGLGFDYESTEKNGWAMTSLGPFRLLENQTATSLPPPLPPSSLPPSLDYQHFDVGKEFVNVVERLQRNRNEVENIQSLAAMKKGNGDWSKKIDNYNDIIAELKLDSLLGDGDGGGHGDEDGVNLGEVFEEGGGGENGGGGGGGGDAIKMIDLQELEQFYEECKIKLGCEKEVMIKNLVNWSYQVERNTFYLKVWSSIHDMIVNKNGEGGGDDDDDGKTKTTTATTAELTSRLNAMRENCGSRLSDFISVVREELDVVVPVKKSKKKSKKSKTSSSTSSLTTPSTSSSSSSSRNLPSPDIMSSSSLKRLREFRSVMIEAMDEYVKVLQSFICFSIPTCDVNVMALLIGRTVTCQFKFNQSEEEFKITSGFIDFVHLYSCRKMSGSAGDEDSADDDDGEDELGNTLLLSLLTYLLKDKLATLEEVAKRSENVAQLFEVINILATVVKETEEVLDYLRSLDEFNVLKSFSFDGKRFSFTFTSYSPPKFKFTIHTDNLTIPFSPMLSSLLASTSSISLSSLLSSSSSSSSSSPPRWNVELLVGSCFSKDDVSKVLHGVTFSEKYLENVYNDLNLWAKSFK